MSLEEFLQSAREGELEIERMSDMLLRLDARAKRVTAVYRQSGGTKGDGPEAIWMQLAEQRGKADAADDRGCEAAGSGGDVSRKDRAEPLSRNAAPAVFELPDD